MSPETFKTVATIIGAILSVAAVIAGGIFGVKNTKGGKAIDKQIADRAQAEVERENLTNQMQEDVLGLRDENRKLRGDMRQLYEEMDQLRKQTEQRVAELVAQHKRESDDSKRYIDALVDHINQGKPAPAPSMTEVLK